MTVQRQRRHDNAQRVQRFDRVQVQAADLDPASRTPEGYLRAHAAIAVPGVMEYRDAAGNVTRELIPPDELHNVDSLRSLATKPVTLGHPTEDVSPDNVGSLGVGAMGSDVEILQESGHVRVLVVLHRRDALQAVAEGTVEVSPGYTTIIDPTPGEHPVYGRYDAIQRSRRYNHLAIVDEARGGPTVKLRADTADAAATRRHDAADPGQAAVRVRLDATTPQPAAPQPAPGGPTMHPFLITLSALLALPYSRRSDGTMHRTDMGEGEHQITEDQLVAAIADAIRGLQAQAASAADQELGEGEKTREQLLAEIEQLQGQLAAMQQDKADRAAREAAEQERADCTELDGLADRLGFDRSAWTEATKADERRLQLAKHRKLVADDAVLRSDSAPQGVAPAALGGMIQALQSMHPAEAQPRADQWGDLEVPRQPPGGGQGGGGQGGGWGGPTGNRQDQKPADPLKASVKARNDQRLGRGQRSGASGRQ